MAAKKVAARKAALKTKTAPRLKTVFLEAIVLLAMGIAFGTALTIVSYLAAFR